MFRKKKPPPTSDASNQTDSFAAKISLVEPQEEVFVLETEYKSSPVKIVNIEIQDFSTRLDREETRKNGINSPKFTIEGNDLKIKVRPEDWCAGGSGNIAVFLYNESANIIRASCEMKESSGVERSFQKKEIKAGIGVGFPNFMPHPGTRQIKDCSEADADDVFRLEVRVRLHYLEDNSSTSWTHKRLRKTLNSIKYLLICLISK